MRMKFATKPYDIIHLTLGMLLHYLGKLKTQIFCRYSTDIEENANKLHFSKELAESSKVWTFLRHSVVVHLCESSLVHRWRQHRIMQSFKVQFFCNIWNIFLCFLGCPAAIVTAGFALPPLQCIWFLDLIFNYLCELTEFYWLCVYSVGSVSYTHLTLPTKRIV